MMLKAKKKIMWLAAARRAVYTGRKRQSVKTTRAHHPNFAPFLY